MIRLTTVENAKLWLKIHPHYWVALVLVVFSHLFVTAFAKFVHWQSIATYSTSADFCRWDCTWFRTVVDEGYDVEPRRDADKANWSFFPLFPAAAKAVRYVLGGSAARALVITSKIALYASILCFFFMVQNQLSTLFDYFVAGAVVAFNPYVLYAHAGYSEPLYFSLAALAFGLLQRCRWISSGLAGAFLSATRVVGTLFALSYLIFALGAIRSGRILREHRLAVLIGLLLCPLGLSLYMLYLYRHTGDALGLIHIQAAWHRSAGNPFAIITHALQYPGWSRFWGLMGVAGLVVGVLLCKARRPDLGVFLFGAILLPLSTDTWGFARYLWWQPPLLYAIFSFLKRYPQYSVIYFPCAAGMASFMVVQWFTGTNIVV